MADEKPRWSFEKLGMTYHCWDDDIQTHFKLSHVKRSHDSLSGVLRIETKLKTVKTVNGVMHTANFNVLSSTTRSSLANMLEKRTPGMDMDWFDGLEWLCQNVILAEETTGEEATEIGLVAPRSTHDRYMMEPLIVRDEPALLFGPGGAGKSFLALACGMSVSSGQEIIPGILPAVTGPVLYLDWETSKPVINDRAWAIAEGHHFKPTGLKYMRCSRPLATFAEELSATVAAQGIVLVIIDSAGYAMGHQGEYGDANEATLRMHEALRIIGVTSLIIDHVNKTDAKQKPGSATPYGSAYKTWSARISWEIRKEPSADTTLRSTLYHHKENDGPTVDPISININWTDGAATFTRGTPMIEAPVEDRSLITLMIELTDDVIEVETARLFPQLEGQGYKLETIRTTFYRAVDRGVFVKTDRRGVYRRATRPVRLPSMPSTTGMFDA